MAKVTWAGFPTRAGTQRSVNRLVRTQMAVVGQHWKDKMLPKHFQEQGKDEYGYEPRQAWYVEKKAKGYIVRGAHSNRGQHMAGHRYPLVYSGDSRRSALGPSVITATATRNKSTVTVPVLAPTLNRQNRASEVTAVSAAEYKTLQRIFQENMKRTARQYSDLFAS